MPEPTTAELMPPQEAFAILTLADSTHGFHSLTPEESRAVARVPVALDVLRGVVERLEAAERALREERARRYHYQAHGKSDDRRRGLRKR